MSSNSVEKRLRTQLYFIVYGFAFIFHTGVNRNDSKGIIYGLIDTESWILLLASPVSD